ncbi:HI1506-related protein [Klebsiella quasipneumoniae]|uniref:HI1506-related protein n=1 Tax=Klebsiella quasipneumoniae TaxID=1463165 RepID=UPI0021494E40|nr:HI1506-related protein [Klebsiella quasipneumoniae]MCR1228292.1 HI1506-related protein [Klebsiella quasipneumoniae]
MPEITITAKRDGFRRCGVAHRDVPVTFPDGYFTDEQIAILRAEPALVVHIGALSGDDDKLKAAQGRIQELEAVVLQLREDSVSLMQQLLEVTADRDRLQDELTVSGSVPVPEVKDNAADGTEGSASAQEAKDSAAVGDAAAAGTSAKSKK